MVALEPGLGRCTGDLVGRLVHVPLQTWSRRATPQGSFFWDLHADSWPRVRILAAANLEVEVSSEGASCGPHSRARAEGGCQGTAPNSTTRLVIDVFRSICLQGNVQ